MTLTATAFAKAQGNWRTIISSLLVFLAALVAADVYRSWYRLRHIKGPFSASLSKLWLIRRTAGGRMHLDFRDVCQKYGAPHALQLAMSCG